MDQIVFNRPKFKQLVLYIVEKCGAEALGNTKLHKILYFADMLFFVQSGHSITGEQYLKQRFGPTARHLTAILSELQHEGAVDISEVDYYGFKKKHYKLVSKSDYRLLQDRDELQMVEAVIDRLIGQSAKEVSEISHAVPWQLVEMGETIPYYTAFGLTDVEVNDEDIEWGIKEATRVAAKR